MKLPQGDTHFKPSDWDNYQLPQYLKAVGLCAQTRTAIDCGAHVGIMTHRMAEQFQTVHAIEPVHWQLLQQNVLEYTNVEVYPYCVGDTQQSVGIRRVNPENSGDNRVVQGSDYYQYPIDHWRWECVDFIKMDIQGHELPALLGAEQTIRRWQPVLMIELEQDDPNRLKILELLVDDWRYTLHSRRNADHIFYQNS